MNADGDNAVDYNVDCIDSCSGTGPDKTGSRYCNNIWETGSYLSLLHKFSKKLNG